MLALQCALGQGLVEPALGRVVHLPAPLATVLPDPEGPDEGVDPVAQCPEVVEAHPDAGGRLEVVGVVVQLESQLYPGEPAGDEALEHAPPDPLELDDLVRLVLVVELSPAGGDLPAYDPGVLVVGAYGGGAEAEGHPGAEVALVGAALQALHVDGEVARSFPYLLGRLPGSQAEGGAHAPHVRHVQEQPLGALEVAPADVEVDEALLRCLHGEAQAAPRPDGVESQLVAHPVEGTHLLQVADADVGAEHRDVLVVELALPALRVHDDVAAGHVAVGATSLNGHLLLHGVSVYLRGPVEDALPEVVCGQRPGLLAPLDRGHGALALPPLVVVLLQYLLVALLSQPPQLLGVVGGELLGPIYHDGLQVLGSHDCPHPGPAAGPPLLGDDGGYPGHVLPRGADEEGSRGPAMLLLELRLSLVGVEPPEVAGVPDLVLVVLYEEVARLLRLARDYDGVEARFAEVGRCLGAQVPIAVPACEGALGGYDHLTAVGYDEARHGAHGVYQHVVRAEGVCARLQLVPEELDGEAPAAHEPPGQVLGVVLHGGLALGEVDPEEPPVPSLQIEHHN